MNTEILTYAQLQPSTLDHWRDCCLSNPLFAHPCFFPEFSQTLAAVRPNARLGIVREQNQVLGYFPFEIDSTGHGRPLGPGISDYQGVIAPPSSEGTQSTAIDARQLIKQCGLREFRYDHWVTDATLAGQHHESIVPSRYLDLSAGFDHYYQRRLAEGSTRLRKAGQVTRKLTRELGDLNLRIDDDSPEAWQALLRWKRQQYERTGALDVLTIDWIVEALKLLVQVQTAHFSGCLMSLRAGDRLVAVHLGMRTKSVVHWWFPTYDPELSKYSPGFVMLVESAKQLAAAGVTRIDLGKGDEAFKGSLTSDHVAVATGTLGSNRWGRATRQFGQSLVASARRLPGRSRLRFLTAKLYRLRKRYDFQ